MLGLIRASSDPEEDLESVTNVSTIVGLARDVVLLLLLSIVLISFLMVFRKFMSLLSTANRAVQKAEEILETVSEKVIQPAASNPRGVRILASTVGFLARSARGRKRKKGDDDGR